MTGVPLTPPALELTDTRLASQAMPCVLFFFFFLSYAFRSLHLRKYRYIVPFHRIDSFKRTNFSSDHGSFR